MILIVDMNWKRDSLGFSEFVSPIILVLQQHAECEVKHFLDIRTHELANYSKVILSGTALKDHATLQMVEKFNWVKTFGKPILGICAGMQTISLVFGVALKGCLQIGMTEIMTQKKNPLFKDTFKAYGLHNYAVEPSDTFDTLAESVNCIQAIKHKKEEIYGVLFHPEVRNQEILKNFVCLA